MHVTSCACYYPNDCFPSRIESPSRIFLFHITKTNKIFTSVRNVFHLSSPGSNKPFFPHYYSWMRGPVVPLFHLFDYPVGFPPMLTRRPVGLTQIRAGDQNNTCTPACGRGTLQIFRLDLFVSLSCHLKHPWHQPLTGEMQERASLCYPVCCLILLICIKWPHSPEVSLQFDLADVESLAGC